MRIALVCCRRLAHCDDLAKYKQWIDSDETAPTVRTLGNIIDGAGRAGRFRRENGNLRSPRHPFERALRGTEHADSWNSEGRGQVANSRVVGYDTGGCLKQLRRFIPIVPSTLIDVMVWRSRAQILAHDDALLACADEFYHRIQALNAKIRDLAEALHRPVAQWSVGEGGNYDTRRHALASRIS